METVAARELRNNTAGVLRSVEAGREAVVTVRGRPVARLLPLRPVQRKRRWLPKSELIEILRTAQADPGLRHDLARLGDETTDTI